MKTSQDILGQSLHDAFVSVLMKVRSLNVQLSDMYVRLDNENEASLIIYDDNDNILHTTQPEGWDEWIANVSPDEAEQQFIALLGEVVNGEKLYELFNETEYNGPFSLLYVDEQMNVLAELLTIDKENIMIGDEFWEKMDRELDEFYEKLMSDIRIK
ncbi:MAG: hypothetical protein IIV86_05525 [Bacteroidaceae bacterium]|jgi:hypothetical protein|nr:hypothetical protein [Bacteroidaceae bacterium]